MEGKSLGEIERSLADEADLDRRRGSHGAERTRETE